jgi:gas vesicle protein
MLGAVVGLGIGLLLAPKAGNEIREQIRQEVNRGVERIRQLRGDDDD